MKKYSKALIVLLVCFVLLLIGCKGNNENNKEDEKNNFETYMTKLNEVIYPEYTLKKNIHLENEKAKKINDFYFKLVDELFNSDTNQLFSPTSLFIGLSMLAEGASTEAYPEIMNLLGIDNLNELREINKKVFENNYYIDSGGKSILENAIWLDENINYNKEFLEVLSEYYYGNTFSVNFMDERSHNDIRNWINEATDNFLNFNEKNFPISKYTNFLLVNTLYFNDGWRIPFQKENNYFDKFNNNGNVEYMKHSVENKCLIKDKYKVFIDSFSNKNKIYYLLPNEGENVNDFLGENILDETYENYLIHFNVPKFEYREEYVLDDCLKNSGVTTVFEKNGLGQIGEDFELSRIKQNVGVRFNEDGVTAVAVTSMVAESSTPSEKPVLPEIEAKLNRPFIYYICDSNNVILFSGVVYNL